MREVARLKSEIANDQRRLIAAHLRTLEESCLRLLEMFRPFDSSLVRRQPLPQGKAEQLQRLVAHLRSRISQAAWDLGLQRAHQDARREASSLVATMDENLRELLRLRDRNGVPEDRAEYLEKLAQELQHTVTDIDRVVGKPVSEAVVAG
jgi:endonuclease III